MHVSDADSSACAGVLHVCSRRSLQKAAMNGTVSATDTPLSLTASDRFLQETQAGDC